VIGKTAGKPISITGLGVHVPEKILTNDDLSKLVDTNDQWMWSAPDQGAPHRRRRRGADRHLPPGRAPRARDGKRRPRIDRLLVVATVTPDMAFPSSAAILADQLGMPDAAAYDLAAGCTGFVYAIAQAQAMLAADSRSARS